MPAPNSRPSRDMRRRQRAREEPAATGWSTARAETLTAVVATDLLSAVLARLHRDGFGSAVRVLDPRRDDIGTQLARLGIDNGMVLDLEPGAASLLLVRATGRMEAVRDLLASAGVPPAMIYCRADSPEGEQVPAGLAPDDQIDTSPIDHV